MAEYRVVASDSWSDFRASLLRYAELAQERRNEFWFRGQGDQRWGLETTLDRHHDVGTVAERDSINSNLLRAFKAEAIHVGIPEAQVEGKSRLELLARHHGLPSPLMDWTLSPYVASYFAYAGAAQSAECVSVWCLELNKIVRYQGEDVELLRDDLPFFENRRALQQRSVFLRVGVPAGVDTLLPEALTRFDLPVRDRGIALQDLDEMLVNATTMFYDLEGAAKTAVLRMTGS